MAKVQPVPNRVSADHAVPMIADPGPGHDRALPCHRADDAPGDWIRIAGVVGVLRPVAQRLGRLGDLWGQPQAAGAGCSTVTLAGCGAADSPGVGAGPAVMSAGAGLPR